jgi:hypothetical protein
MSETPQYRYLTRCTHLGRADVADLQAMTERGRPVGYATFARHVPRADLVRVLPFYTWAGRGGLRLANDWHVGYYRSTFRGAPVYYLVHSAIEYIFAQR